LQCGEIGNRLKRWKSYNDFLYAWQSYTTKKFSLLWTHIQPVSQHKALDSKWNALNTEYTTVFSHSIMKHIRDQKKSFLFLTF
jgi:hypothetical protein